MLRSIGRTTGCRNRKWCRSLPFEGSGHGIPNLKARRSAEAYDLDPAVAIEVGKGIAFSLGRHAGVNGQADSKISRAPHDCVVSQGRSCEQDQNSDRS